MVFTFVLDDCPQTNTTRFDDSCIYTDGTSRRWSAAQRYCEQNGANLPSIHSDKENQRFAGNILHKELSQKSYI